MFIPSLICSIGWIIILTVWKIFTTEYTVTFSSWGWRKPHDDYFVPYGYGEKMLIVRRLGVQGGWDYLYEVKPHNKLTVLGLPIGRYIDNLIVYIKNN